MSWNQNAWKADGKDDWKNDTKADANDWKNDTKADANDWKKDEGGWSAETEAPAAEADPWAAGAKNDWSDNKENEWKKDDDDWKAADDDWVQPEQGKGYAVLGGGKTFTKEEWEKSQIKAAADKEMYSQLQKDRAQEMETAKKTDEQLGWEEEELFAKKAEAGINFKKYADVKIETKGNGAELIPMVESFDELFEMFGQLLPIEVKGNLERMGYQVPTPVQKCAIPVGLACRDMMVCAQTGSGKTCAFLVPIIGRMMVTNANPIGGLETPFEGICDPDTLILTPTRELCVQIYEESRKFVHKTPYRPVRIYGGEKPGDQIKEISYGCDLMVATPGRLIDFLEKGYIRMDRCSRLVLDEGDRMLDMGFGSQVRQLVDDYHMPKNENRQTMMFSATFPDEVQELAKDFLHDYVWIAVGIVNAAVDTVKQELREVDPEEKSDQLVKILDEFCDKAVESKTSCIVFGNSKNGVQTMDEFLWEKKFDSCCLHGDLKQTERDEIMRKFRSGQCDVLLTTDLCSRGIDVDNVSLVINYDFPHDFDTYIHRIGRTGRIGREGRAISFIAKKRSLNVSMEDVGVLKKLVNCLSTTNNSIPEWLQPLIDAQEGGDTKWGGRDNRDGDYGNWKNDNSANWWDGNNAEDKKEEAPAAEADGAANNEWGNNDWGATDQTVTEPVKDVLETPETSTGAMSEQAAGSPEALPITPTAEAAGYVQAPEANEWAEPAAEWTEGQPAAPAEEWKAEPAAEAAAVTGQWAGQEWAATNGQEWAQGGDWAAPAGQEWAQGGEWTG